MKKALVTILLLVMLITMVSCGGDSEEPAQVVMEPTSTLPSLPTVASQATDQPTPAAPATVALPPTTASTAVPTPTASPAVTVGSDGQQTVDDQLIDVIWEWEQRTSSDGSEILISIPDPFSYTLVFNTAGSLEASLDCGISSGTYSTDGSGGIFMSLDDPDAAQCGPESNASEMADMFGPAQDYVFEEDGQQLIFNWAAGGPRDIYRRGIPVGGIDITGKVWQWQAFQDPAGLNDMTLEDPEKYTFELLPEGAAAVQADCNQVSWTYTLEVGEDGSSGSLAFSADGPSTQAFCGEESLDQQYLTWLAETVAYVAAGEELFLNLRFDSGDMIFGPGTASTPDTAGVEELPSDFIEIDLQGLAQSFEWQVVDGSPIPAGPGGQGFPDHIVLGFDGEDPLQVPYSERRIMYLFPVEAYLDLYSASGNGSVEQQIGRLQELIDQTPDREHIPDGVMPLLPPPNSQMDRWVQFSDLDFNQGQGVRYMSDSPLRQDIGVWTNETMDYYYQGLSADGRYYVSFKWPVSTALLPDSEAVAPEDVKQQASSNRESYDAYVLDLINSLNGTSPADWAPNSSVIDAIISSLSFKE